MLGNTKRTRRRRSADLNRTDFCGSSEALDFNVKLTVN